MSDRAACKELCHLVGAGLGTLVEAWSYGFSQYLFEL